MSNLELRIKSSLGHVKIRNVDTGSKGPAWECRIIVVGGVKYYVNKDVVRYFDPMRVVISRSDKSNISGFDNLVGISEILFSDLEAVNNKHINAWAAGEIARDVERRVAVK